jgi:hypothetical protein
MVNDNADVHSGIANGTTTEFVKAILKRGAKLQPMKIFGYWVNSVTVDEVDQLELRWQDYDRFQGKFRVNAVQGVYKVKFPVVEMGREMRVATTIELTQFPVVCNYATTGHKLQGKSLDALLIAEWSRAKNWAYVVLSRVRTLAGLFLDKPIPDDIDFRPHPDYLDMMARLRLKNFVYSHRHGGMELISFILIAFSNSEETIATVELSRESIATVNVAVDEILPFVTGLQMRNLYVILETGAKKFTIYKFGYSI